MSEAGRTDATDANAAAAPSSSDMIASPSEAAASSQNTASPQSTTSPQSTASPQRTASPQSTSSPHDTVESAVRAQLAKALGGIRGTIEAAVPTIGFTATYLITEQLKLALWIGAGAAVVLLIVRIAQKSTTQFVLNSLVGIGIAAVFALRSGKAEDAFLPGIIYNGAYAAAMVFSIAVRWPVVGFIIGSVTGDPTAWRRDPGVVRLCSRLTWLLLIPCLLRVVVQYPLYLAGEVGWLGASKIALGWPLQIAALGAMVWVLARGRTPLESRPAT